ncbi:hybrid sensor histidine kinase/response regulator [Paraburkholderia terrae]|uniref:hybrid sensor histidine kinase/response regulator n=1 Tax=Paraburkholderia terrae TaxID=311230 RepID=UPI00296B1A94|nr:hybrid sensor histidine kinase/response regulator [Paraburkholderia terrae]MDW3663790.1 hybrid sensor histidine kinase/response regulator [Paraburkholderia terrae]
MDERTAFAWRDIFAPPERFACGAEDAYLLEYGKRFYAHRCAALVLGLATWTLFSGWDFYFAHGNPTFNAVLKPLLALRATGIVVLLTGLAIISRKLFEREWFATLSIALIILAIYAVNLAMIWILPLPYAMNYYFVGLSLILMFLFGLTRLRSRPAIVVAVIGAMASILTLYFKPHVGAEEGMLISMTGYYFWVPSGYLISFVAIGSVVAIELERTSRTDFTRQRQLDIARMQEERDNAELKSLNSALAESKRDLENRTDALVRSVEDRRKLAETSNKEKSYFIAAAIHDVRQPATAMLTLVQPIFAAIDNGNLALARDWAAKLQEAGEVMNKSFNDVLDLSRIESGLTNPEYEDIDLDALLRDVITSMSGTASACGVAIRYKASRHGSLLVRSDFSFLRRIFLNLISNGIKFSDGRRTQCATVIVGVIGLKRLARVDVVDNGIGVAEAHWDDIFKPFFQLGNPSHDANRGAGIGLSLVNAMIGRLREHRLEFGSRKGSGSRFSVQLPLARALGVHSPATTSGADIPVSELAGRYVLVLEERVLIRESIVECLRSFGLIVDEADSFADFIGLLRRLEMTPDAILADHAFDSTVHAADILAGARTYLDKEVPVLFLVDDPSTLGIAGTRTIGTLRKPFLPADIVRALNALLAVHPSPAALEQQCSAVKPPE